MKKISFWIFLALILPSILYGGPISELYVVKWANNGIAVLQGNQVVRSWSTSGAGEISIAVTDTVKTFGHYTDYYGAKYSLSGTYLGTTYTKTTAGGTHTHDGTTDGTYNYTVDYSSSNGTVYRFDSNWSNPQALFNTGYLYELAITYDFNNDSFWIGSWTNGTIRNYSRTGALLSSFSTPYSSIGSLALDRADNTLWFNSGAGYTFYQYSRAGTYLSSTTFSGLNGSIYGAEFAYSVPEPSVFLGMILGISAFIAFRKK